MGTTLLLRASQWLRDKGMKRAKVSPFNLEGEDATQRAVAFYVSNGGTTSEKLGVGTQFNHWGPNY